METPENNSTAKETVTPEKANHFPVLIVLLIVLLMIITAGVLFFWKRTRTKTSDSPSTTSTTTATPTATASTTISVLEKGKLILTGGYADPTVVKTSTGYRMYVNTFGHGPSGYLTYTSPDGLTWTKEKDIIISGVATGRAIVLPTGIRFYYPGPQPIKATDTPADMYSTFSTDGVTFKKDAGSILSPRAGYYVEGPTVFQLPDKTWRMYFNENTVASGNNRDGAIWGASSADGLTWTRDTAVTLQSDSVEKGTETWTHTLHPFVLANPKGGYIMFYNTHSELYAATSTDGLTWKKIGKIGIHGADMDGYFQADGTIRAYYGDFSEKDGGMVYMAVLKVE